MNKEISTKEAIEIIKEWGVDCDNFVAHKYRQFMNNGEANDNSIEVSDYFLQCLKIVCDIGIKSVESPNQAM